MTTMTTTTTTDGRQLQLIATSIDCRGKKEGNLFNLPINWQLSVVRGDTLCFDS